MVTSFMRLLGMAGLAYVAPRTAVHGASFIDSIMARGVGVYLLTLERPQ